MPIICFQDAIEIVLGEQYVQDHNIENSAVKVRTYSYQYVSPIKLLEQLLNQVDVFLQVKLNKFIMAFMRVFPKTIVFTTKSRFHYVLLHQSEAWW